MTNESKWLTAIGGIVAAVVPLLVAYNEAGRGQHRAVIVNNVIEMSHAPGATAARGVAGPRWEHNAWSRLPPIGIGTAADVTGALGLADPGAALTNMLPEPGHSADLDAYRPTAGSPLIGVDGMTLGALRPLSEEPPVEPPPPPPPGPDWDALIERAAAVGVQLATIGAALADAREQVAVASLAQDAAAGELAALLAALDEAKSA